jgi:hypothetical protein
MPGMRIEVLLAAPPDWLHHASSVLPPEPTEITLQLFWNELGSSIEKNFTTPSTFLIPLIRIDEWLRVDPSAR